MPPAARPTTAPPVHGRAGAARRSAANRHAAGAAASSGMSARQCGALRPIRRACQVSLGSVAELDRDTGRPASAVRASVFPASDCAAAAARARPNKAAAVNARHAAAATLRQNPGEYSAAAMSGRGCSISVNSSSEAAAPPHQCGRHEPADRHDRPACVQSQRANQRFSLHDDPFETGSRAISARDAT